jgi:hypothetical protein
MKLAEAGDPAEEVLLECYLRSVQVVLAKELARGKWSALSTPMSK